MKRAILVSGTLMLGLLAASGFQRDRRAPVPGLKQDNPLADAVISAPFSGKHTNYEKYSVKRFSERLRFSTDKGRLETTGISVSQGGREISLDPPVVHRSDDSLLHIDHGKVQEEYRFEPGRVEQLFYLEESIGNGSLIISTKVQTSFTGPVIEVSAGKAGWKDPRMVKGGLWFCDETGGKQIAYYGAMAIDATGRKIDLEPTYESGEIKLRVPALYMANVAYPLLVDPWIESVSASSDGKVSNTGQNSENPSLCLDSAERPVIAWIETNTSGGVSEILVHRFNGTSWVDISFAATTVNSSSPSLASASSGNLYLAWSEDVSGNTDVFMRWYNGSSWQTAENISQTSGTYSNNPSIGVNSAGQVFVAWEEEDAGATEIYVARRDGTNNWVGVSGSTSTGGISLNPGFSDRPALAFDSSGRPVVAWEDSTNFWDIYLKRLEGSSWVDLGGSGSGGGVSNTSVQSHQAAVAVDQGGYPVVAWSEQLASPGHAIFLRRWTGTQWEEIDNSAGSGVSSSATYTNTPSVWVNHMGNPVVSWSEETATNVLNVYLKYLDSGSWIQVDLSASGGGVSNSTNATFPTLALNASGNPVLAWQDGDGTGSKPYDIYLRSWYQDSPLNLNQFHSTGSSYLPVGGLSSETSVVFKGIPSSATGGLVRLQVEVQPIGTGFTGNPTGESLLVTGGSDALLTLTDLTMGSKHWRARTVDEEGFASQWISFGENADGDVDFAVLEYTKTASGGGLCGLLGIESLILFGLLVFLRRRI